MKRLLNNSVDRIFEPINRKLIPQTLYTLQFGQCADNIRGFGEDIAPECGDGKQKPVRRVIQCADGIAERVDGELLELDLEDFRVGVGCGIQPG